MDEKEAKDFLVQQVAEQADIEGVPLSSLEKRMMYFTESGYCPEDPIHLNEEFEAKYDTPQYERKIPQLLRNSYARLKKENPQSVRTWDEAVACLRKGDHYILVLLALKKAAHGSPEQAVERPRGDVWKLLGTALLVTALALGAGFFADKLGWNLSWKHSTRTSQLPPWLRLLFLAVLVVLYLISAFRPNIFTSVVSIFSKIGASVFHKDKSET